MEFLHTIASQAYDLILQMPYFWVFIFMTIESSFIPFPSEAVMIPAWYFSSLWNVNFILALIAWISWSLLWAIINYYIWYYWWRKLIIKLIWENNNNTCINFFEKYWDNTTFIWRFIPWIRQIISLPAWAFKMDIFKFSIYTSLWAWIWCLILLIFWYFVWANKELFFVYKYYFTAWAILFAVIMIYLKFKIINFIQKKYSNTNSTSI